jgi:predicted nucleic acid-binding protein
MKNGIVIADADPIFSLAVLGKLELLNALHNELPLTID